jgi:hypothetical protein
VVLQNSDPAMLPEVASVLSALGAAVVSLGWRARITAIRGKATLLG